jgi:hypothetical protein
MSPFQLKQAGSLSGCLEDRIDTQTNAQETEQTVADCFCFSLTTGTRTINAIPFLITDTFVCWGLQGSKDIPFGMAGTGASSLLPGQAARGLQCCAFDHVALFLAVLGRGREGRRALVQASFGITLSVPCTYWEVENLEG